MQCRVRVWVRVRVHAGCVRGHVVNAVQGAGVGALVQCRMVSVWRGVDINWSGAQWIVVTPRLHKGHVLAQEVGAVPWSTPGGVAVHANAGCNVCLSCMPQCRPSLLPIGRHWAQWRGRLHAAGRLAH